MNQTQKASFRVVGMYCTTCKPIVENQLRGNEAIKSIDIDFMTDSVIVEYDPTLITKEKIKERLEILATNLSESIDRGSRLSQTFLPV